MSSWMGQWQVVPLGVAAGERRNCGNSVTNIIGFMLTLKEVKHSDLFTKGGA